MSEKPRDIITCIEGVEDMRIDDYYLLRQSMTLEQMLTLKDARHVIARISRIEDRLQSLYRQRDNIDKNISEYEQHREVCNALNRAIAKSSEIFTRMIDAHYNPDSILVRRITTRVYGSRDDMRMYIKLKDLGFDIDNKVDDEIALRLASLLCWEAVNDTTEGGVKIKYDNDNFLVTVKTVIELPHKLTGLRGNTAQLWIHNKCIKNAEAEPVVTIYRSKPRDMRKAASVDILQPKLGLVVNGDNIPKNTLVKCWVIM